MFCGKCGKSNTDDVRFCVHCSADMGLQTPPRDAGDTLENAQTVHSDEVSEGKLLAARYEVKCRLGSGGMGEVWRAVDTELDNMSVAIKVLPLVLSRNSHSINALKREAAIALRLTHANICRLHTFHADDDIKFLVMEHIEGQTLEALLDEQPDRRMALEELLPLAGQIAAALDYAHGEKPPVLHRDIKPANMMITTDGVAKLLDFGIARELKDSLTRVTGRDTPGTLLYMSPEQYQGRNPMPTSDVYSFAATVYECLAGHAPFHRGAIGHQLLHMEPPVVSGIADGVNNVLQRGLAKEPVDRPSCATELVDDLRTAAGLPTHDDAPPRASELRSPPAPVAPVKPAPGLKPETSRSVALPVTPPRRRSNAISILLAFVLVVVVTVVVYVVSWRDDAQVYTVWPFDSHDAAWRQEKTATALGVPIELTVNLGNTMTMELVLIPAGEFVMGSKFSVDEVTKRYGGESRLYTDEHPPHRVKLTKPFYMCKHEVTVAQFRRFAEETGYKTDAEKGTSEIEEGKRGGRGIKDGKWQFVEGLSWRDPGFPQSDDHPVVLVSWVDAQAYIAWLNKQASDASASVTYKLPTEAEWEYASRAGTATAFWWGDNMDVTGKVANVGDQSYRSFKPPWKSMPCDDGHHTTAPCGSYRSNAFGLHDMIGNVWELCEDRHGSYAPHAQTNPQGSRSDSSRVLRGGSWRSNPAICRSAVRNALAPSNRGAMGGFRVAARTR